METHKNCNVGTRRCTPDGNLAQIIHCTTDHGVYRRSELAAFVGKRTDAFLRMSDGLSEEMPLRIALLVMELTRDTRIAEEFARRAGGVFIKVNAREVTDEDLFQAFLRVTKEVGEDSALLLRALQDGHLGPDEAEALAIEIDQTIQAALAMKQRVLARAQRGPAVVSLQPRGGRS
ncbi:phage regulatory CII family protein [Luteitalea sp.]